MITFDIWRIGLSNRTTNSGFVSEENDSREVKARERVMEIDRISDHGSNFSWSSILAKNRLEAWLWSKIYFVGILITLSVLYLYNLVCELSFDRVLFHISACANSRLRGFACLGPHFTYKWREHKTRDNFLPSSAPKHHFLRADRRNCEMHRNIHARAAVQISRLKTPGRLFFDVRTKK